jgi:pSer/pThr/pTyr-binding forkhead associated (FHA) protein
MNENKNKKFKVELQINLITSLNESKDLFLIESDEIKSEKFLFSNKDNELFIINYINNNLEEMIDIVSKTKMLQILKLNSKIKIILFIKYNDITNSFSIFNSYKYQRTKNLYKAENCERIWKIFNKDEYIEINEEDIIKLGHLRLKFDKIFFENNNENNNILNNSIGGSSVSLENNNNIIINNIQKNIIYSTEPNETHYCRICYQKEVNKNDPLICPCKCYGSMKFVHLSCLKNNINLKIHKKHDKYYDMYLFQNYNCEICLSTFPKYLIIKSKKIYLIEIDISNYKNYALIDLIQYDDKNDYIFHIGYLILRLENDIPLKIGRKKENDVIFNDLSISGSHCELICKNNILYLKDLGSKYGTLKYIQNEYEIKIGDFINLISNKYKFEFNLIKKESLLYKFDFFGIGEYLENIFESKCCGASSKDKGDYEVFNNSKNNIGNNIDKNKNNDDSVDNKDNEITNEKMQYYEKFKDFDSYNDFVINMDNSNYLLSQKEKKD